MLREAAGPRQHFQARGHSFSLYGPTLGRQITCEFFFCSKLVLQITNGFASVCLHNFVIESTCSPSTNDWFIKNLRSERVTQIPDKDVSKKRYFSIYITIVAFISPFISLNLTMPVFCIGSREGRTESDDKGPVCYYWASIKSGTWNIPDIPEHPGTWHNYHNYEKSM